MWCIKINCKKKIKQLRKKVKILNEKYIQPNKNNNNSKYRSD